jgi:predicted transcriptional regulator
MDESKEFYEKFKGEAVKIIRKEFKRRKSRNKSYSLRSFARDLKISPATTSRAYNGTSLSPGTYFKILDKIGIKAITNEYMESLYKKSIGLSDDSDNKQFSYWQRFGSPKSLKAEEFSMVSDLKSMALYTYFLFNRFIDYEKIESVLKIKQSSAKKIINNLVLLGLIELKNESEIYAPAELNLAMEDTIHSENIKFVTEVLYKAIEKLNCPDLQKSQDYVMSNIFPVDTSLLEEAREYLNNMNYEFQERFCVKPSEVFPNNSYNVAIMCISLNLY